jgi:hypothetical protein
MGLCGVSCYEFVVVAAVEVVVFGEIKSVWAADRDFAGYFFRLLCLLLRNK